MNKIEGSYFLSCQAPKVFQYDSDDGSIELHFSIGIVRDIISILHSNGGKSSDVF